MGGLVQVGRKPGQRPGASSANHPNPGAHTSQSAPPTTQAAPESEASHVCPTEVSPVRRLSLLTTASHFIALESFQDRIASSLSKWPHGNRGGPTLLLLPVSPSGHCDHRFGSAYDLPRFLPALRPQSWQRDAVLSELLRLPVASDPCCPRLCCPQRPAGPPFLPRGAPCPAQLDRVTAHRCNSSGTQASASSVSCRVARRCPWASRLRPPPKAARQATPASQMNPTKLC